MTEHTAKLQLPFLAAGQAQKHVTVNETLTRLDALVQLCVVSATTGAEPGSPNDGEVYILPSGKTGDAWGAMTNGALAYYRDGAWEEIAPREGWIAFVRDADAAMVFAGSVWAPLSSALHVSATDRVLGRASAGAGAAEEITCTAAGRALLDDANASAQRATLGLGTMATQAASAYAALTGASFAGTLSVANNDPILQFYDADAGADEKRYFFSGSGGQLFCQFVNDAGSAANIAFSLVRSGYAVASCNFGAKLLPTSDASFDLGSASARWGTVYAATGTINTSDAREKTALAPIPDGVKRAVKRVIAGVGVFKRCDAVAAKGEAARLHIGVTAQGVEAAFAAEGEDARAWALFCADETEDGGERLGLRHDQLFMLALAALAERDR